MSTTARTLDELDAEIGECQQERRGLDVDQAARRAELYQREHELWVAVIVATERADAGDTARLLAMAARSAAVAAIEDAHTWRRLAEAMTASTGPVPA